MGLFRGRCPKCNFPLWRSNDECRGCWLAFDDDDRNKRIALRFWGRKGFDWVGLTALGFARVAAKVAVGTKAEANSTEGSPATNDWLPAHSRALPGLLLPDPFRYQLWLTTRAYSFEGLAIQRLPGDIGVRLR
jgi:hypothetical protein